MEPTYDTQMDNCSLYAEQGSVLDGQEERARGQEGWQRDDLEKWAEVVGESAQADITPTRDLYLHAQGLRLERNTLSAEAQKLSHTIRDLEAQIEILTTTNHEYQKEQEERWASINQKFRVLTKSYNQQSQKLSSLRQRKKREIENLYGRLDEMGRVIATRINCSICSSVAERGAGCGKLVEEELRLGNKIEVALSCGHLLCTPCWSTWEKKADEEEIELVCPFCRARKPVPTHMFFV